MASTSIRPGPADRLAWGGSVVLAFAGLIVFWPPALDRWALPKVLVLGLAGVVAVVARPRGTLPRWLQLSVAAAAALLVIAALMSTDPAGGLLGRWPRYEGVITAGGYALALWSGARLLGPGATSPERRFTGYALGGVATVLAAVSALEALGLRPIPTDLARPGALLGNATDQGAVAAGLAVTLLALAMRARGRERILIGSAAGLAALTVVLSGSRAALAAIVIGAIAVAVLAAAPRRTRVIAASTGLAGLAATILIVPATASRVLGTSPLAGQTISDRILIWRETLEVVRQHPLLGAGPSGFQAAVARVHGVDWFTTAGDDMVLDSPHDVLLQALVVAGPLAVLGFAALIVVGALRVARRLRDTEGERGFVLAGALGSATILLVLLTHVTAPGPVMLAALLAGAALAGPVHAGRRRVPDVAIGVVVTVWLALVGTALAGESALGVAADAARSGRLGEADVASSAAAALRPWDADTPLIAAEAFVARLDSGDQAATDLAILWSRRALLADPASLGAAKAAITADLAAGDLAHGRAVVSRMLVDYPRDPWIAHRGGALALLSGDADEAERLLLLSTRLDPDRADPWLTLAFLYQQEGRDADAESAQAHADALGR